MFRENIGEQLLKEAAERMDKAHCATDLKADEKGRWQKKPAHGMVIVIGSKAGQVLLLMVKETNSTLRRTRKKSDYAFG